MKSQQSAEIIVFSCWPANNFRYGGIEMFGGSRHPNFPPATLFRQRFYQSAQHTGLGISQSDISSKSLQPPTFPSG
jgi:hypothetical protein